jgi:hypothetical protein
MSHTDWIIVALLIGAGVIVLASDPEVRAAFKPQPRVSSRWHVPGRPMIVQAAVLGFKIVTLNIWITWLRIGNALRRRRLARAERS